MDDLLNINLHYYQLRLLQIVVQGLENYWWIGLFAGLLLNAGKPESETEGARSRRIYFRLFIFIASFLPALLYFITPFISNFVNFPYAPSEKHFNLWIAACAAGFISVLLWLRYGVQLREVSIKKLTRSSRLEKNKKTDIRTIQDCLPSNKKRFDPLKYINQNNGVFIGLDEKDKPVVIKKGDWINSHILLSGRTRCGKGVAAQVLGWQSIQMGELFCVLDPKGDKWMPHIYQQACQAAGKQYVFLDLRQSAHQQINLFAGCSEEDIENMLVGAFSLSEKGDSADFYKLGERKAARQAARWLATNPGATPSQLYNHFSSDWLKNGAAGFAAAIEEMADLASVNARLGEGVDIEKLAQEGGCLYVVGDMLNPRIVRMQRMLLLRLMQLAKNRDHTKEQRVIRVFADEFRTHISRPAIVSLATTASSRLLLILAMQSFEDVKDCPADLNPDMVAGAVLENCGVQISYQIKDGETAERLAAQTGTILVDDETRQIERNIALSETTKNRSVRQSERYFIDTNMIRSLDMPDEEQGTVGCAVVVGVSKLARFCFTSPVMVERTAFAVTPTILPISLLTANSGELPDLTNFDLPELVDLMKSTYS